MEMSQSLSRGRESAHGLKWGLSLLRSEPFICYASIAGVIVALVMLALRMGHFTDFYSIDGDIKYLASLSLAHHPLNSSISYPFHRFDPSGKYTLPLTGWYNGHDYAGYSLPFEYIGALFLALFGSAGLIAPSILATGMLMLAQMELASLIGLRGNRALLLITTVVSSPLLFYAISFWEHAWGVALLLGGLTLLLRAASREKLQLWIAVPVGFLYISAALMRREMLIPAIISLVLLPILFRKCEVFKLCLVTGALMGSAIGAILLFHPEPLALGLTHVAPGRSAIAAGATNSKLHRLQWLAYGGPATAILLGFSAMIAVFHFWKPTLNAIAVPAGSLIVAVAYTVFILGHFTFASENPIAYCPLGIWGVWSIVVLRPTSKDSRNQTALWILGMLGVLGIAVSASDFGGPQWGPRYLVFVYPVLILLAFKLRQELRSVTSIGWRPRVAEYSFVGLLAMSVLLQIAGLLSMSVSKNEVARAQAAVAATRPTVVISADPSIDSLAPLQPKKTLLFAPTARQRSGLLSMLSRANVRRLVLVCGPGHACHWNTLAGWTHGRINRRNRHILSFAIYRRG